jgi:adenylosuccinate synthase
VNGLQTLVVTKLDILDELDEIPVGVQYEFEGRRVDEFPAENDMLENIKVRYRTFPGWRESTRGLREFRQLPQRARDYLNFLAQETGVEVAMVSTGPQRDEIMLLADSDLAKALAGTCD